MGKSKKGWKQEQQALIFLHIPKAAGSTLNQIIQRQYGPEAAFSVYVGDEEIRGVVNQLPAERKRLLRVLGGHMSFGLHELLPQPSTYMTILREPVDRLISFFYYVLRSPDNDHHHLVTSRQLTLKEYILSGMLPDNGQTRRLAGIDQPSRRAPLNDPPCSTDHLQIAKRNLQKYFAVVGLSERFDETLLLLKRTLGWRTPFYVKTNVTRDRLSREDIPEDTLRVLREHTALDVELYEYAQQLFQEQIRQQGPGFARELATFKLLNRLYGVGYSSSHPLRKAVKQLVKLEERE